jgi:acetate kinase
MGTRSGDLDPGVVAHLHREGGLDLDAIDTLLNRQSGLKGLAGANDLREVHAKADAGDAHAAEALEVFCYRVRCTVGAYVAALGGLDALVFTAGIGENDADVRARVCGGLGADGLGGRQRRRRARGADERGAGDRRAGAGGGAGRRARRPVAGSAVVGGPGPGYRTGSRPPSQRTASPVR